MTRRSLFKYSAIIASIIVSIILVFAWMLGERSVAATPRDYQLTPNAEPISLLSSDGISLFGAHWQSSNAAKASLLMLHGNGADISYLAENAAWFAAQGYGVLAIDFRAHGRSQQTEKSFGLFEARDALAASLWLKKEYPGLPHAIIGISLGGAAAMLGEGGPVPADAYVLQAMYGDIRTAIKNRFSCKLGKPIGALLEPVLSYQSLWRYGVHPNTIAPKTHIAMLGGPALFIAGGEDCYTTPAEMKQMATLAGDAATLWTVPNVGHVKVSSLTGAEYRETVDAFFQARFKQKQSSPP